MLTLTEVLLLQYCVFMAMIIVNIVISFMGERVTLRETLLGFIVIEVILLFVIIALLPLYYLGII